MSNDLLTVALDAHGGIERWRRAESITAAVTVRGALFEVKAPHVDLGTVQVTADTSRPLLTFRPFAGSTTAVFEPNQVAMAADDGTGQRLDDSRSAFSQLAPDTPWDDLQLLYFTGYAMWNYLCTPFVLTWPGFVVDEIEPWTEEGQTWRRLRVTFPPDVPTHNTEQTFYLDPDGLLRRVDYNPDILGSPPVAHYCDQHRDFSGLTLPARRRIYPHRHDGRPETSPILVDIDVFEIEVT